MVLRIFIILIYLNLIYADKMTKMTFKQPELTEEENESDYLPNQLKCDACLAIAHQIKEALIKEEKRNSNKMLRESDLIDAIENACDNGFEDYGLKQVNEMHRLSGPGLETEVVPGLVQMGGKWPRRIRDLCLMRMGEMDESVIYAELKSKFDLRDLICKNICKLDKTEF